MSVIRAVIAGYEIAGRVSVALGTQNIMKHGILKPFQMEKNHKYNIRHQEFKRTSWLQMHSYILPRTKRE